MKTSVAILASILLLAGCTAGPGPGVSLVRVQFTDATAFETTAQFTLRLNNSLPEAVSFTGGVHRIYLNDLYCGEGLSNERVSVERLSSTTQVVTVYLNNFALATRLKAIIESKGFDYRIQSTFHGERPTGRRRSTSEGRLELKDFQPTPPATNAPAAP
jgi:LEA14-like dessication related protein